jgi:hypothetical protein
MAAFCVETKLFARGIRLVVSALVEDLVFNEAKGNLGLSVDAVRQAIERVTTMDGMGVNGFNGLDGINGTDKPDESFNAAEPRAPSREVIYGT